MTVDRGEIDESSAGPEGTAPRLSCTDVTVRFGGLVAVDSVDLAVPNASIVGLVGPNGAGKSTLFGVLSGLVRPTTGRVFLDGVDVTKYRPQRRAQRGLARTFQHLELFSGLTVREHLVLAHRAKHAPRRVWSDLFTMGSLHRVDPGEQDRVDELIELLELEELAERPALGLPLGVARLVELGRALATAPTVLLLDEPSSGLDSADTARFESTLRRVATDRGISVLLVEHDMDLVMRLCSSINVLDFGMLIASGPPEAIWTNDAVRAAYLGEQPSSDGPPSADEDGPPSADEDASPARRVNSSGSPGDQRAEAGAAGRPAQLSVRDLCVRYGEATALSGVSFELQAGEALAVLGPNGAGKSSLARAISGLVRPSSGCIQLAGEELSRLPSHRVRRRGVVHLPEERGVFRALTVTDNLKMAAATLSTHQARRQAMDLAFEIFPQLAERRRRQAKLLSGGEQQMLSLVRSVMGSPAVIVADELSLGLAPLMVDVVFEGLERARDAGVTVIMIEQYVHRALAFADRCIVLQRGEIVWSGRADVAQEVVPRHYLGDGMVAATS